MALKIEKNNVNGALESDVYINFFLFSMLKTILLICAIVCFAQTESVDWVNWNNFASANNQLVHSYAQPNLPANFVRYVDNTLTQNTYNSRANQYRYMVTHPTFGVCNIYCGPRSFLTRDINQNIICQRDMSNDFWGGVLGTFDQFCIPDFDKTNACQYSFPSMTSSCKTASYINSPYSIYECCYVDTNTNNFDLNVRGIKTSLYTLRNAE